MQSTTSKTVPFEWIIIAGLTLAPFAISENIASYSDLPKRGVIQTAIVFSLIAWVTSSFFRKENLLKFSPLAWLAVGIWAMFSIGYSRSNWTFNPTQTWIHWSLCIVAFILIQQVHDTKRTSEQICSAMRFAGIGITLISVLHYYGSLGFIPDSADIRGATFGNRNWLAQFLVITTPAIVAQSIKDHGAWRLLQIAAIGTSIGFLTKINSTNAYLTLILQCVLGAVIAFYFYKRNAFSVGEIKKQVALKIAISFSTPLLVVAFLSPHGIISPVERINQELSQISSATRGEGTSDPYQPNTVSSRLATYRVTTGMFLDNPLMGIGLGQFEVQFPKYNMALDYPSRGSIKAIHGHAHNDWLQGIAELGLVSAITVFAFLYTIISKSKGLLTDKHSDFLSNSAFLVSIVGSITFACFSYPFHNAYPPYAVAVFCGLLVSQNPGKDHKNYTFRFSILLKALLMAASVTLIFCIPIRTYRCWSAEAEIARIGGNFDKHNWEAVLNGISAVEELNLGRTDLELYRAQALLALSRKNEAAERLTSHLSNEPYSVYAHLLMAASLPDTDTTKITEHATKAAELTPWHKPSIIHAAQQLYRIGNYEKARHILLDCLRFNPKDVELQALEQALPAN